MLGSLFAAGGVVKINADQLSGSGTAIANGTPRITIDNQSPDYLLLNDILIPDQPGGAVLFTGTAQGGIGVQERNRGVGGVVQIHNSFAGNVGNVNYGPALGLVGDVDNQGGLISITNDSGSIITNGAGIFGQQVNISAPRGLVNLNTTADKPQLGGNPYSEWSSYMIWPGGRPQGGLVTESSDPRLPMGDGELVCWRRDVHDRAKPRFRRWPTSRRQWHRGGRL